MSMWPVASDIRTPNRDHRLSAQLVPDSGNEFERLELLREATEQIPEYVRQIPSA
jgi:hypothetical protein